jgi:hypothetical protein
MPLPTSGQLTAKQSNRWYPACLASKDYGEHDVEVGRETGLSEAKVAALLADGMPSCLP